MTTYRFNSIAFDRKNLAGVDSDCIKGLNSFLNSRERELNTIESPNAPMPPSAEFLAEREAGEALVTAALYRLMPETRQAAPAVEAPSAAPLSTAPCQTVKGKSGRWSAILFMRNGLFGYQFSIGEKVIKSGAMCKTAGDRMRAIQALAKAADAPDDTPPTGGLPPVAHNLAPALLSVVKPTTPVATFTPGTAPAVSSASKPKIADIRRTIEFCDWVRNDLSGATVNEFKAMDVPGKLTPHIEAVKALEIPPRFAKDIERQAWAIECANKAIARWQAKQ